MSVSLRSTLISGAAFATAGVMALGPNIVAPPVITLAQPVVQLPTVHVAEIALTGFTLDLYSALNGWAAFGVQVLQDFFFWNPDIAAGIGNFYTALERVVTAVVTTIDSLLGAPTDFMGTLTTIVNTLLPAFGLGVPTLAAGRQVGGVPDRRAHRGRTPRGRVTTAGTDRGRTPRRGQGSSQDHLLLSATGGDRGVARRRGARLRRGSRSRGSRRGSSCR